MKMSRETTIGELQDYVRKISQDRGFTHDPTVKFLKLVEEVGELSKALGSTVGMKSDASRNPGKIEEELADVVLVVFGIADTLDIDIAHILREKEKQNVHRRWE